MDWNWKGARWWRFDFHSHTPASDDYGKGPDQATLKAKTPKDWLLDYMKAGVDCVAVTDHNSGDWVDQLRKALVELESERPEGFRALYLFPGVEISGNGGVHILAILGPDKTTSDIDSLLGEVRYRGTTGGSDGVTQSSLSDILCAIHGRGGLAIPAHADESNGLFKLGGTTLDQVLGSKLIIAIEVIDPASEKPQLYRDRKLRWAEVIGSDSHHPSGNRCPGSHFTWVKMSRPALEGLRLALRDGALSVRRSDEQPSDPNTHGGLIVESVEVEQARYMGRACRFNVQLNPWLNAVIGGRGTGKSTLLEFLRTALRREGELPGSLASEFEKYRRVYESRGDDGLLTENSRFVVIYRKDRTRFRVQWSQRGDIEPIEVQGENGEWSAGEGDVAQRFPARIYSQKQVFELAKAPLALLRIVDEAPGVDRRTWDELWKEEETRFLSHRAKLREIEAGLADESRLRGELEDVKRKLAVFEEAGHAEVLKEYQRRLRQNREVENWQETWAGAGDRLRDLAADLVPDPLDPSPFHVERPEDSQLLERARTSLQRLEQVRDKLEQLARDLDNVVTKWREERDTSSWKRTVSEALRQYEALRQRLAAQGAGDPSAYGELVQQRQTIEGRLKQLQARRLHLDSVRRDADASLERLRDIRRDLTQRRAAFLAQVLSANPYVRIEVEPYGAQETVEPEFRRLIHREAGGFEKDIGPVGGEGLLALLYTGPADVKAFEERLVEVKRKVRQIAAGECKADDLRDQRFATHLSKLPPEAFDRLDSWFPEDSLGVQYSTTADGSEFRSILEGSPGQKTAALLAFLLSYGEEPIILDQPEDDLDNNLIYDLIVTQLRNIKQHRQVIVVTHNANIVVNGDAELVVALAARGGETHQDCEGSLQEKKVRDTICAIMEGGREAFKQRYRRIVGEEGSDV